MQKIKIGNSPSGPIASECMGAMKKYADANADKIVANSPDHSPPYQAEIKTAPKKSKKEWPCAGRGKYCLTETSIATIKAASIHPAMIGSWLICLLEPRPAKAPPEDGQLVIFFAVNLSDTHPSLRQSQEIRRIRI